MRDRKKGIDANTALRLPVLLEKPASPPTSPSFGSAKETPKEQTPSVVTSLHNQFVQEQAPTTEDLFLAKYIEGKMKELKNQDIKSVQDLRTLLEAEKMQNEIRREKEAQKVDAKISQVQAASLTKIDEVELPNKFKIENILETEKATYAILQKRQMLEKIRQQLQADGLLDTPQFRFLKDSATSVDAAVPQAVQEHLLPEELVNVKVPAKSNQNKATDNVVFDKYMKNGKKG